MTRKFPSKTAQRCEYPRFSGAYHFDVKGGDVRRVDFEFRANDRSSGDIKPRTAFHKLNLDHFRPSTAAVRA